MDANRVKWAIFTTTAPVMYILGDLGEFMEILNQQQIQKEKRKKYRNKKKTLIQQQTEVKSSLSAIFINYIEAKVSIYSGNTNSYECKPSLFT